MSYRFTSCSTQHHFRRYRNTLKHFSDSVLAAAGFPLLGSAYALAFPTLIGVTTSMWVRPSIEAEVAKTIVVASNRVVEHIIPAGVAVFPGKNFCLESVT